MTLIQALRSVANCFSKLSIREVAILKDEQYGYTVVTTAPCVDYQLKHNHANVLVVYKKLDWSKKIKTYDVMSKNTIDGPKPGPLMLRPKPSKNNRRFILQSH